MKRQQGHRTHFTQMQERDYTMTVQTLAQNDRLKAILSGQSRPLGGQVQFLGLDEVKQSLGERWEKKQDFIRTLCQRTIKPHIGKTDICIEYGELGFVILFGELDDETATIKCGLIKAEIMRQLRGDHELRNLGVQTIIGDLSKGELKATDIGTLLANAAAKKEAVQHQLPFDRSPVSGTRTRTRDSDLGYSDLQKAQFQRAYWATMKSTVQGAGAPFALQGEDNQDSLGDVEYGFVPLVNLKSGVISTFHCAAVRLDALNRIVNGHDVLSESADEKSVIELDQLTLARAKIGLMDMTMRKRIALVSVPVSYVTMSRPRARQDFIAGLETVAPELRRYLVITLTGYPDGVPTATLCEHVRLLKKYSRGIAARVQPETTSLGALKDAGVQIVGFKFSESEPVTPKMVRTMQSFRQNAVKLRFGTFVRNIKRKEHVRAAIDLGHDYFSGPAIAELSDYVGPVREIDLSSF